ncbi:exodeoxyribonuclease VII small subunit [Faecalitalea cylindroides]|uniref:Exodeoxyribonuclease 7 small subunit n=2 Tax=Faecalitalea cylindroides TaxID=39483 RepID=A0A1Y4LWY0_9FIRM|nr:exodeoxyribonuclease VII small subunit [Faecalitalea cylindroides]ERK47023.1 exodeoxyribonuclease VII, small subunit [[Eubacterium] cylindroides ATCC 27803] [Faecalitalea cylindroides ATCC 27803]MBM6653513.1 exodeoxyribonuclease VII small subunit [Faecalitalea cylindroides]OUN63788.1 exodeoxyribonuclease VII small subunit [Faecalitalea cylindroides]OUP61115.1 exodeoxyribonuclease VII small subunit [Faecalitalea cylindroides]
MAEKKMKFQDAMNRLDEIVALLNNSSLELEEAMKYFEEGLALSKQCEKQLKEFENKMDQLMVAKENDDESEQ